VILVLDAQGIFAAVSRSVALCLNTVIPALFAFLALSTFAVSSGIVKSDIAIFALSLVGGYPVGARLLAQKISLAEQVISPKGGLCPSEWRTKAERMLMYCYCGSPAFLIAIGGNFGLYIWLSNALACVAFAIIVNIFAKRDIVGRTQSVANEKNPSFTIISDSVSARPAVSDTLIHAVTSAGGALYRICLMMLAFAAALRVLEFVGIMGILPDSAYAFAEITYVMDLTAPPALLAALTSMGGLCVLFQTKAIVGGQIKLRKFLLARIPIGALSAGICHLLTRGIYPQTIETLAVSRLVLISEQRNPTASICLMLMVLILIASSNDAPSKTS
jgi:hypothetical protein